MGLACGIQGLVLATSRGGHGVALKASSGKEPLHLDMILVE